MPVFGYEHPRLGAGGHAKGSRVPAGIREAAAPRPVPHGASSRILNHFDPSVAVSESRSAVLALLLGPRVKLPPWLGR